MSETSAARLPAGDGYRPAGAVPDILSMQLVLEQALEQYHRQQLLDTINAAYAALRTDPEAWSHLEHERLAWEQTLADGLEET
jgi:hypothetical protein